MSLQPFEAPEEPAGDATPGMVVVGTWMMAGAVFGAAVGATLQFLTWLSSLVGPGLVGGASGLVLGALAWGLDRRDAKRRPLLVDGRGRLVRPMGTWVLAAPLCLGMLGVLGLVVLGTIRSGSWAPFGFLFGTVLLLVGIARPLLGARALTGAVEAMEAGRTEDAVRRLRAIEGSPWATRPVRAMAHLNLGLEALRSGRLDEAATWYRRAGAGSGRALASTGLAFVRVLESQWEFAESLLSDASASAEGRTARVEIDGVRLLLVLRRDGPSEACLLGDRLLGPGADSLFLAVLAAARMRAGDEVGAQDLIAEPLVVAILAGGFGQVVPELRGLSPSSTSPMFEPL
jgi:hypothetical protein